jgi:hypothetical protein
MHVMQPPHRDGGSKKIPKDSLAVSRGYVARLWTLDAKNGAVFERKHNKKQNEDDMI